MPLPIIIGGIAAVAGVTGLGAGVHGGLEIKEANETMKLAKQKQKTAMKLFETENATTTELMDSIGKKELEILNSFERFSDIIEKIQGRPEFKSFKNDEIQLPEYEAEELRKVSTGAGVLLGGIGGTAVGTAGGFAAAGATTSAVMALGTASTGTAISTLSGAAAINATLAALGGGSLAAGGGGMALGMVVLGGATLGVGLFVGGIIFNITGNHLSDKADEAYEQACRTEKEVNKIVKHFMSLASAGKKFYQSLVNVEEQYTKRLESLDSLVNGSEKTHWDEYTKEEKALVENTVLLVGLLYKMCQIKLVLKKEDDDCGTVNEKEIHATIKSANKILNKVENNRKWRLLGCF